MTAASLPDGTRPGRVALRVGDLRPTTDFYRDVVGLVVRSSDEGVATLGTPDRTLLELHEDPDAPERGPAETGLYHTAFLVPSRAALGDAVERIRRRWRLDGASDHRVSEALYLTDPEGNGIEVYRDRPRSEWPTTDDGYVAMTVDPLDVDAVADAARGTSSVPAGTTIGHVHLEVSSLVRAESFYVDALGLRVRQRMGSSALFVAADDYHHHVGLNTWQGLTAPATGRGLAWFELLVPGDDAVEAAERRLAAAGFEPESADSGFDVADADGITLHVRSA
ncbi:VOC family protein [Haloarchaeobius sp. HRN-SO-5]|uniref:VOC family protein n=1 Tax=Haloarchaeobius sp. HRN-SO-5 TaxID=3446118 RepID=UPI003EB7A48D